MIFLLFCLCRVTKQRLGRRWPSANRRKSDGFAEITTVTGLPWEYRPPFATHRTLHRTVILAMFWPENKDIAGVKFHAMEGCVGCKDIFVTWDTQNNGRRPLVHITNFNVTEAQEKHIHNTSNRYNNNKLTYALVWRIRHVLPKFRLK